MPQVHRLTLNLKYAPLIGSNERQLESSARLTRGHAACALRVKFEGRSANAKITETFGLNNQGGTGVLKQISKWITTTP